jgi:asparagine synthase (glutamine-hydrolysing)
MCGIAGNCNRLYPVKEKFIRSMCSLMQHRGPDDEGYYCKENVGFGMRRLSIIDLAGGHQPIANENKTVYIIFNGEIYNYIELQKELVQKGHTFRTSTDTEVIIHLYEEYGKDCVQKLNGMFAFAIWDENKKSFFIARDRLGIKPLYYYYDGNRFLFASEIKSLLIEGGVDKKINYNAVWDYLTYRYVPEPDTMWEGIKKLPPAHSLEFDLNAWELKTYKYWEIPYIPYGELKETKSESDYLEEFGTLFEDSVSLHLQADVPVGVLLSGGLDSSAVLAAISRIHNNQIYSFSVGYKDEDEFSELQYAREMARHVGARNHEIVIGSEEFVDFLDDFVWYTDEPIADLASIPLYYVSRLAADHVKVVLSGEGADEILGGYDLEHVYRSFERVKQYQRFPSWFRRYFLKYIAGSDVAVDYCDLPSSRTFHMTNIFSHEQKKELFPKCPDFENSLTLVKQYYDRVKKVHPLNQVLSVFSRSWLVEDLLMKADKMTMANSIELRVPFLDYRIVEWAAKAPVSMKIGMWDGDLVTKKVLRMYCKDTIPASILNRPKKGFPVPAYKWLNSELKGFARDTLDRQSCVGDLFEKKQLDAVLEKGVADGAEIMDRHRLWSVLILELWMKKWLKK